MQAHLAKICKENIIVVKEATVDMELVANELSCEDYNACMFMPIAPLMIQAPLNELEVCIVLRYSVLDYYEDGKVKI